MSDYLPSELWEDIFYRLSLKSIGKCACVCKAFKSLITNLYFISENVNRSLQPNHGNDCLLIHLFPPIYRRRERNISHRDKHYYSLHLYNQQVEKLPNLKFPPVERGTLIGTCNGLFCFADSSRSNGCTVTICNPYIRKYMVIFKLEPFITLINYLTKNRYIFQFCYDSKIKDFKVLRLMTSCDKQETLPQLEVYSLASASWRSVTDRAPPFFLHDPKRRSQTFVNGALHWVVMRRSNDEVHYTIISFNVVKEKFGELKLPHSLRDSPYSKEVATLVKSDLLAVYSHLKSLPTTFSVWMMKEYGVVESWTLVVHFDSLCYGGIDRALSITRNGEVVLVRYDGSIIILDPIKGIVNDLGFRNFFESFVGSHVESLFLMNKPGVLSY